MSLRIFVLVALPLFVQALPAGGAEPAEEHGGRAPSTANAAPASPVEDPKPWHRLVGILQYLEADYPAAVESQSAFELAEQRAFIAEAVSASTELGPRGAAFESRLLALQEKVNRGGEPQAVSAECGQLVQELVVTGGLVQSPQRRPDLARGAELFKQNCAVCHGSNGNGDVPLAANMEPKPANFLSAELMEGLSPYKAFNTTAFGVPGTAMPAFATLSDDDRWSVAFFVFSLRQPPCGDKTQAPTLTLQELASASDGELEKRYGADALRCLRRELPTTNTAEAFQRANDGVDQALSAGERGDYAQARQALLDAYLQGIEPIEPTLSAKDTKTVRELEALFLEARARAERQDPSFAVPARALKEALEKAEASVSVATPLSVFWVSFFILLREGFEAMIVVTALLAVLKKLNATERSRVVHAGWLSALVAGVLAFVFGRHLISGAEREWVEGIVALLAVAMLLYTVLWLNARANVRRFMGELREKVQASVGKESNVGLFLLAFMATFRESAETALFLQGLALDSLRGAIWGGLAGLVALALLVWMVSRVGFRLPMKTLFSASTALLYGTSIVLLGKGLRALQEVGAVPHNPVTFIQVDLLGIFPDALTLCAQAVLLAAPLVYWVWRTRQRGDSVPNVSQVGN